ncbi:MAG: zf-HC2 domain-containing protein [Endomicrobiales bacterium]|jgi:predicted anti-sigma-YlaC factor YlaD
MQCKEIRKLIMLDFIDNELDDVTRQTVERHLAVCSECRTVFESLCVRVQQIREVPVMDPPASLWTDILQEQDRRREDRRSFSFNDVLSLVHGGWAYNATLIISLLACMSVAGMFCTGAIQHAKQATVVSWETGAFNDIPGEQVETAYTNLLGG